MAPSRKLLQRKGIVIEEDLRNISTLPSDVKDLRDMLLNFEQIVPLSEKIQLKEQCKTDATLWNTRLFPLRESTFIDTGHKKYRTRYKKAKELRETARSFGPDKRKKEDFWHRLINNFVFEELNEEASDVGVPARDWICCGSSNQVFDNTLHIRGVFHDGEQYQPKPDLWFTLSLYDQKDLRQLKGLERWEKGVQYFAEEDWETDGRHIHAPVHLLAKSFRKMAFPWFIGEGKHEFVKEEEALCQAANASHLCLVLCEKLASGVNMTSLPIVALIFIGPKVKLFLTYKDSDNDICRMSCIWSGHIEHILCAVQLRCIVDRLLFWALRFFKPWVTECLEQWYKDSDGASTASDEENDYEDEDGEASVAWSTDS